MISPRFLVKMEQRLLWRENVTDIAWLFPTVFIRCEHWSVGKESRIDCVPNSNCSSFSSIPRLQTVLKWNENLGQHKSRMELCNLQSRSGQYFLYPFKQVLQGFVELAQSNCYSWQYTEMTSPRDPSYIRLMIGWLDAFKFGNVCLCRKRKQEQIEARGLPFLHPISIDPLISKIISPGLSALSLALQHLTQCYLASQRLWNLYLILCLSWTPMRHVLWS